MFAELKQSTHRDRAGVEDFKGQRNEVVVVWATWLTSRPITGRLPNARAWCPVGVQSEGMGQRLLIPPRAQDSAIT